MVNNPDLIFIKAKIHVYSTKRSLLNLKYKIILNGDYFLETIFYVIAHEIAYR